MNMHDQSKLSGIVGGSGSGKTWLADRLSQELSVPTARLSLDDFYLKRSDMPRRVREGASFDDPGAVDWRLVMQTLRDCRDGQPTKIPKYDFTTRTRLPLGETLSPAPLVLAEGLWLLWLPRVRSLFDLKLFLECPTQLRFERRLARDVKERGRTTESVRRQFWKTVAPMHDRFVAPQRRWADLVFKQPPRETDLRRLVAKLDSLATAAHPKVENTRFSMADAVGMN
jgi:uridine kinase